MRIGTATARPVGTIPLPEVSGLALGRDAQGRHAVMAIGDRAATVAWALLAEDVADLEWQTLDLRHAEGSRIPEVDPQLEAIAVDGQMGVVLMQESPNRAEFIDGPSRRVRASVSFEVPDLAALADVHVSWRDPRCSHTEGIVLMRRGHALLIKEKDPVALLEFGPAGQEPLGIGPDSWLPDGAAWQVGSGDVVLSCLAAWRPDAQLRQASPDLSDAEVGPDGGLLLTGDQARVLVALGRHPPAEAPYAGTIRARAAWQLAGIEHKPEGLVVLPGGDVLIACDRRKVRTNLFMVAASELG
jgi:hypothetical protein